MILFNQVDTYFQQDGASQFSYCKGTSELHLHKIVDWSKWTLDHPIFTPLVFSQVDKTASATCEELEYKVS